MTVILVNIHALNNEKKGDQIKNTHKYSYFIADGAEMYATFSTTLLVFCTKAISHFFVNNVHVLIKNKNFFLSISLSLYLYFYSSGDAT